MTITINILTKQLTQRIRRQLCRDAQTVYLGMQQGAITSYWAGVKGDELVSHVVMPIGNVRGCKMSLAGARGLMEMRGRASR